jgi:LacI family transcriptional regulator
MHDAKARVRFIHGPASVPAPERAEFSRLWLADAGRPTAVVTYNDTTALPILYGAAALRLAVPRDLSIVTFCETVMDNVGVAVTTMVIPWHDVGRSAARMLLEKIETPKRALPPQPLPFNLGDGRTCAPPA